MKLLKNGINLFDEIEAFVNASQNLFIYVPYIKLPALKLLLNKAIHCQAIVVRWDVSDFIFNSSDVEVYDYCKSKGIKLFRNPRLHLKAFVDDYKRCLFGSANISRRALNSPPIGNYNYEICGICESLGFEDRLYFKTILNESTLITDDIYSQIKNQISQRIEPIEEIEDFKIEHVADEKNFLISSLPMSNTVKTLWRVYSEKEGINDEEINCALHDVALYKMPLGLSEGEFITRLQAAFFSHPFINAFVQYVQLKGGEIYFGEAKKWIHDNCADVPTPRKWELTENIQILYKWLVELANDTFAIDRPSHSERLYFKT
ncbi:phospholipase D-like domain-containing protein [Polluticoccus soli]|uniref:phospholipase D-like domain-containing protein n=1 Tax=Polluticoccus soli TaxID=3034150 RepID=UPI0023E18D6D|nr:phospholipase D-like domain-containing protein [Flavipsychrobacter sp. JY13-12]